MNEQAFKDRVCDDGVAEVTTTYADEDAKREGSLAGFEIARALTTRKQFEDEMQGRSNTEHEMRCVYYDGDKSDESMDAYWRYRWATLQIEFVYSVMLVAFWAEPGDMLSGRATRKVLAVVGEELG